MNEMEKLRVILPHWIEHNAGHGSEFGKWSQLLDAAGEEKIATLLARAEALLKEAEKVLRIALHEAGGEMGEGNHQHPHHHH